MGKYLYIEDVCAGHQEAEKELRELRRAEKDREILLQVFRHLHANNGQDDSCQKCGLDIRHPIHKSLNPEEGL